MGSIEKLSIPLICSFPYAIVYLNVVAIFGWSVSSAAIVNTEPVADSAIVIDWSIEEAKKMGSSSLMSIMRIVI